MTLDVPHAEENRGEQSREQTQQVGLTSAGSREREGPLSGVQTQQGGPTSAGTRGEVLRPEDRAPRGSVEFPWYPSEVLGSLGRDMFHYDLVE